DQSPPNAFSQQNRITGIGRESLTIYLISFGDKAADVSLRQNLTKIFRDLFELGGNGRLPVLAHDGHAAIACFTGRDVDWDLAKQRDAQPLRLTFTAAASEDIVAFGVGGRDEVTHVLNEPEHGHVDFVKHGGGLAGID